MRGLALLAAALALFAGAALIPPAPAFAAGEFEKRMLEVRPVDPQEFVDQAARATEKIWVVARGYSVPLVIVSFVLGAVLILAGALLGKSVSRAGAGVIFAGLLAFVLINYAPEIAGLARALAAGLVGGVVR